MPDQSSAGGKSPRFLTLTDVAEILNTSSAQVYALVRRGELAAPVQAGIEALGQGRTGSEPVRSRFGWHVLRLQRRIEGRTLPFEIVGERIADMLEARSWSLAAARYVAGLAARAQVEGVRIDVSEQTG